MLRTMLIVIAALLVAVIVLYIRLLPAAKLEHTNGSVSQSTDVRSFKKTGSETIDRNANSSSTVRELATASNADAVNNSPSSVTVAQSIVPLRLLLGPGKVEKPVIHKNMNATEQAKLEADRARRDPEIEYAVLQSEGTWDMIAAADQICSSVRAETGRRFFDAKRTWESRNRQLIEKARSVLHAQFDYAEMSMIGKIHDTNSTKLESVRNASPEDLAAWCREGVDDAMSGKFDLMNDSKAMRVLSRL